MKKAKTYYINNLDNGNKTEEKVIDIKLRARSKSVLNAIIQGSVPKISGPPKPSSVPFYKLFRFATCWEVCTIWLGVLFGILAGLCIPIGFIIYGEFNSLLIDRTTQKGTSTQTILLELFGGGKLLINATAEENKQALLDDSAAFGISCAVFAVIQFVTLLCSIDLLNAVALKQINKIRRKFFESILRQDMSWYDTNTGTNFASSITEDLDKMKNGMGEKIGVFIFLSSSYIISIIMSLIYGWKLTLVLVSCAPIIILSSAIRAKVQSNLTAQELKSYGGAGTVADEVLGNIKTVVAFEGENIEIERYSHLLESATSAGSRIGAYTGISSGIMWFVICASYALGFWYGVQLILNDQDNIDQEYTPAVLMIIFFSILYGAQNMGFTSHHLESFTIAQGAAAAIFAVIDRKPIIDSLSNSGLKPNEMKGNIQFRDIHFEYPARPTIKVLNGANFSIKPGESVAFVGGSGCGKSTMIQLVQRMYDPSAGSVTIDGIDISTLNVHWLRQHIGVVGQEPVLFATSIADNIALGCSGASTEDIENAAIEANCHEFIMKLPNGYDTIIGERGSQLSGGQKQRIAIARALIRKPTILLLDEATSALDFHSETKVQQALDRASYKCTTLIVSHRLSTIRNVDRIIFVKDGKVAEMGTHEELMELGENYHGLVQADILVGDKNSVPHLKKEEMAVSHRNEVTNSNNGTSTVMSVEKEKDDKILIDQQKVSLWRIMKLNSKEWPYLLFGTLAAIVVGGSFPIFAVLFGDGYAALSIKDNLEVIHRTELTAIYLTVLGVLLGIGAFLQSYLFSIAGTRLTTRIRVMSFGSMLKQEIGWYDEANNNVGALCARLSGDAAIVQGATGFLVGAIMQLISSFAFGIGISLSMTWKLTLIALLAVPAALFGVFLEDRIMRKSGIEEKQAMNRAVRIAVEAISNVRTVASLNQENYFIEKYMSELASVNKALQVKGRLRGAVISFGQITTFLGFAVTSSYGGYLVANGELEYRNVVIVSQTLIYAARTLGQVFAYAPNFNAAWIAAERILQLLDRTPKIASAPEMPQEKEWKADGYIKYSKIDFTYPTRPNIQILQKLNLTMRAGTTVALVGGSGCGKSTCIQLLQRLYDPDAGALTMDSKNISKDMSIRTLRSQMGIVSQEPVLFDRTIAENIAYGDNSRQVTEEEIIKAAITSNIHNFISALPLGYETRLGVRGTQLSGGQKQRIAIARALVRDPRILLLDEATSALDNQSEKVVQAALDAACEGRTCILIAHRLATIRNADVICVLDGGNVIESGTHDQLIASGGMYSKLYYVNK